MKKIKVGMWTKTLEIEIKPCPCCGNMDLYLGHESAMSWGVRCWGHGGGCGLSMVVEMSDYIGLRLKPKNVEEECLMAAVAKWNRRES